MNDKVIVVFFIEQQSSKLRDKLFLLVIFRECFFFQSEGRTLEEFNNAYFSLSADVMLPMWDRISSLNDTPKQKIYNKYICLT